MNPNLNKYRIVVTIGLITLWTFGIKSQDTTLIKFIDLPYSIYSIANDSLGNIWLSGVRGLQYFDYERESFITYDPLIKTHIIAEQGRVIPFVGKKGQLSFPWERSSSWLTKIPHNSVRVSAAQDKFGNHWVSTGNQIFIFSVEDRFDLILEGYSTRGIYMVGEDLYVNTFRGIRKNDSFLLEKPIYAEGEIKEFKGSLYFAWGGLMRYHPDNQRATYLKFESTFGDIRNPRPMIAQCLEQFNDTLWVGTNFGLGYVDDDTVVMVSNYPNIQDIEITSNGLFVAGSSLQKPRITIIPRHSLPLPDCDDCKGVYKKANDQLRKLDLPVTNYRHILESDGTYYFASDSGVVVWNGEKVIDIITEDDALSSNLTCATIMDNHGFLWVNTFSGLNRINLDNGNITSYLRNIEFNYRSFLNTDSMVYLGSVQGIYTFDPNKFIGDDILPPEPQSTQQVLLIFGTLIFIIFFGLSYFFNRYYSRKVQAKEAQLKASEEKLFLIQIEKVVFTSDVPFTVNHLAENLGMSERTLYRKFKDYGITPGTYLKKLRIRKARYLLNKENINIPFKEVAHKVGYTEVYLKKLLGQ